MKISFGFLLLLAASNSIGVLGPELAFDSLWYHLTLPKIYLEEHRIFFIPGNLLYYSAMPKLSEMYYISSLAISGEVLAKTVHFIFGILTCLALYKIAQKFLSCSFALFVVLIFYANLVVGWESITAYVDLTRTFFEVLGLFAFSNWYAKKRKKWLILSAVMIGLAITTKLLAVGSLLIFLLLILYIKRKKLRYAVLDGMLFISISLIISLPWFLFSAISTGNPVYPFFTGLYPVTPGLYLFNPWQFLQDSWGVLVTAADPILPIYLIVLPLLFVHLPKFTKPMRIIAIYSGCAFLLWYITPRTGGGRFILPYLPAFSLLVGLLLSKMTDKVMKKSIIGVVIIVAVVSLLYRSVANAKYIPVVTGQQTKHDFLTNNLNFSFGDFYDTDNYFTNTIKPEDTVLLYGFHNLYYVNFPFIHESWAKKGDRFNYIAVQGGLIPNRFSEMKLVHYNSSTNVRVYTAETFTIY